MKPVAVFQHSPEAGPGFFAEWLARQRIPIALIRIDRGDAVPARAEAFSGLCLMGGPMSVNDPLPWIAPELALIRDADARGIPVIGHCLGGQLLARALGGVVTRSPVKEIGWRPLRVTNAVTAREWLGAEAVDAPEFFQWHGDTFTLPPAAVNFLASELCANQAFVIERAGCAHLGMQFHCEMTPALVRDWAADPEGIAEIAEERRRTGGAGVADADAMLRDVEPRTQRMNALAARLYARWAQALARTPECAGPGARADIEGKPMPDPQDGSAPIDLRKHVDQWLGGAVAPPPIAQRLGIRLVAVSDRHAITEMRVTPDLWNAMGTLHGGVFADLADVAMGAALATSTQVGETFSSVNLAVTFFTAVREGLVRASASVVRRGRNSGFVECAIENEAGVLLAKASSVCFFQARR